MVNTCIPSDIHCRYHFLAWDISNHGLGLPSGWRSHGQGR